MRVIVAGAVAWADEAAVRRELAKLPAGATVIHGDCPGADELDIRRTNFRSRPSATLDPGYSEPMEKEQASFLLSSIYLPAIRNEQRITTSVIDAIPPEIQSLKEGTISGLIAQSPTHIGAQQVNAIVDYLKQGKSGAVPVSSDLQGIPQRLLTKDTVDDPANADYIYKAKC